MQASERFRAVSLTAATTLLLAPFPAWAADKYGEDTALNLPAEGPAKAEVATSGTSGSLVRTFVGLAIVVGVIYGLTWVMRQMKAAKEERSSGFGLSSEATIPLGHNRAVHLIRAGRELVLVGAAEQGVVPIRTYTEDEARALGLLRDEDDDTPSSNGAVLAAKPALAGLVDKLRERTVR